ncbi:nesprin-3 [Bombina bombina]|uniref:nesprin-3 n=1 Tax=Bombina bombina TaxID=8345 RepID=UPI00235A7DA4|nr:nesprin-3 [Bombina bombina]
MTQILQDEFETSIENAESWMKEIHGKLKENDKTEGPRSALEFRLRETEKICSLEPEGKLLLDIVLTKAQSLLNESSEDEKHEILSKLKHIKAKFEETTIYMVHCHSRIEWVWLHWSEYLKALGEFTVWVHNMKLTLEPDTELQLGLKEKRWQYEHYQVLLKDVKNQSHLLDRLLEEAASLYNRIGDPSVDESVQNQMMVEYKQIKKKAQERASFLEKIMKEHEAYDEDVNQFRLWLNSVIEKLKCCVAGTTDSTEHRLSVLAEINKDVESGYKQLEVLEMKSAEVIKNTSPMGAEQICKELEELRRALAELKAMNDEEEENLRKTFNSENAFLDLARQLEININEFRKAIQRLEESLESGERVKSEEDLVALWRTLNATKSALAAEEPKAERVKVQLKDLFRFSKDVQPLSDSVIAAMREYQRAKNKAFKLSTETESALRQNFQNPLREFQHWRPITERVLGTTSAFMSDIAMNNDFLLQVEMLLEESCSIKEKLAVLKLKKEQMSNVFGEEKAESLLSEAREAEKEREALHNALMKRKNSLQNMAIQSKKFDAAFELLQKKVSNIRNKAADENELQPDLVGKETQLKRFQMLQEDLLKLEPHIKELKSIAQSNPIHKQKAGELNAEYQALIRYLESNIRRCQHNVEDHWDYNKKLLDLQRWIMVTRQELESYHDSNGECYVESREKDFEVLMSELPEKEIQLNQIEAQGHVVMENSSPEGSAYIQNQLRELTASWASLKQLWDTLFSVLKKKKIQRAAEQPQSIFTTNDTKDYSGILRERDPNIISSPSDRSPTGMHINTSIQGEVDSSPRTTQSEKSHMGLKINSGIQGEVDSSPRTTQSEKNHMGLKIISGIQGEVDSSPRTTQSEKSHMGLKINSGNRKEKDHSSRRSQSERSPSRAKNTWQVDLSNLHETDLNTTTSQAGRSPIGGKLNTGSLNLSNFQESDLNARTSQAGRSPIGGKLNTGTSSNFQESDLNARTSQAGRSPIGGKLNTGSVNLSHLQDTDHNTRTSQAESSAAGTLQNIGLMSLTNHQETDPNLRTSHSKKNPFGVNMNTGSRSLSINLKETEQNPRTPESERSPSGRKINHGGLVIFSSSQESDQNPRTAQPERRPSGQKINHGPVTVGAGYKFSSQSTTEQYDDRPDSPQTPGSPQGNGKRSGTMTLTTSSVTKKNSHKVPSEKSSNNTAHISRHQKERHMVHSEDVTDSAFVYGKDKTQNEYDHLKLLKEFDLWLQGENTKLSKICSEEASNSEELKSRSRQLQKLQARVPQGQRLFETLLLCRPAMAVTEDLRMEDLRYRWMLYKSKLVDCASNPTLKTSEEPRGITKNSSGGLCSFLHRVCCAALPLQLLLLLLLLLAFLLPLMQENRSCTLSNNFAHSFNLMLKYEGPPPT